MKPRIGVYICHCGMNIAGTVDVKSVVEYASHLPNVVLAKDYNYVCSDPGQLMIQDDIKRENLNRVIVAACSPRMHELTFQRTLSMAGLNPYLLEVANIREHCSWPHEKEPENATEKAKDLVRMAVARASLLEPLEPLVVPIKKAALVIGGGIAGITASLKLADSGFKVYLVERQPSIGGRMAQLDKTFPTLDCSACILTPLMVDVSRHPNIVLLTYSEVKDVSGYVGNFKAKIEVKPRYVDEEKCTGCDECPKVCPVTIPNEFDVGLGTRKAIYRPFPQAVPNVFSIDRRGIPPCRATCPAGVNVQGYIALITQGKFKEALELIRRDNPLPAVCGRVCFRPCEAECERRDVDEPLAINALKRFVADRWLKEGVEKPKPIPKVHEENIAVIGSGPAGLAAAYDLVRKGYPVTVFEALPKPGGMLRVGIPEYRLAKEVLDADINYVKELGVEIRTNVRIGGDLTIEGLLRKGYKAIFVAVGAQKSRKLGIRGEELKGVIHAIDFLREVNLGKKVEVGDKVAVIGGGNVAVDAARTALRLGSREVHILYRRSREEMPANREETEQGEKEGVKIHFLVSPKSILGKDGRVTSLECTRMKLGAPDKTGRRRPIPVEGSDFIMKFDTLTIAIGETPDLSPIPERIKVTKRNTIAADPVTLQTSMPYIFGGGDAVSGSATVIEAIAAGRRAAVSIDRYLRGEDLKRGREKEISRVKEVPKEGITKKLRQKMPLLPLDQRVGNFEQVEIGFTEVMVREEAERCLMCGGCSECLECEKACEAKAVNFDQRPLEMEIKVGTIIVATGYDPFDAGKVREYGYGTYKNVITGLEFERVINAAGPTCGKIVRLSDGNKPKSVAFILCVGSREEREDLLPYCCRIGCVTAIKHAYILKSKFGDEVDVFICYTDLRTFGKGHEEFYQTVRDMGVKFIHGKPSEIHELPDQSLAFDVFDMATNLILHITADLVVLMNGLEPSYESDDLARLLKIPKGPEGFLMELHPKLKPVETATDGIFIAGTAQGPKDITDTVAQAGAAAAAAGALMAPGQAEIPPILAVVDETTCGGCRFCEPVCEYGAIKMEEVDGKLTASVLEALCKGCGVCASTCPTKAISMHHFTDEQILAQVRAALEE